MLSRGFRLGGIRNPLLRWERRAPGTPLLVRELGGEIQVVDS